MKEEDFYGRLVWKKWSKCGARTCMRRMGQKERIKGLRGVRTYEVAGLAC